MAPTLGNVGQYKASLRKEALFCGSFCPTTTYCHYWFLFSFWFIAVSVIQHPERPEAGIPFQRPLAQPRKVVIQIKVVSVGVVRDWHMIEISWQLNFWTLVTLGRWNVKSEREGQNDSKVTILSTWECVGTVKWNWAFKRSSRFVMGKGVPFWICCLWGAQGDDSQMIVGIVRWGLDKRVGLEMQIWESSVYSELGVKVWQWIQLPTERT